MNAGNMVYYVMHVDHTHDNVKVYSCPITTSLPSLTILFDSVLSIFLTTSHCFSPTMLYLPQNIECLIQLRLCYNANQIQLC
ncbi:hypothetical protein XELAEV_18041842mg [Xenopus laevis]|uniref:Uncharacterized protein n=1 Tax=Xenopus laevis TaxID=8355 RepID=A0A974C301_XENLA|nr:hypothetical protein XELAEV_18041842mg [Xenopus laevis]